MAFEVNEDTLARQEALEAEMVGLGVTRYREKVANSTAKGKETRAAHGMHLLKHSVKPLADALREFLATYKSGRPSRRAIAGKYLEQIDPNVAAMITARVVLDRVSSRSVLQTAAVKVGSALEDEVRFRLFEAEAKPLWNALYGSLKDQHERRRHTIYSLYMKRAGIDWTPWPQPDKLHLGMKCIEMFCSTTGLAAFTKTEPKKNRTVYVLEATEATMEWIKNKNEACEVLNPVFMPTIVPPVDWDGPLGGGYHSTSLRPLKLVKTRMHNFVEELKNRGVDSMPAVYRSINALQRTAWRVNASVLDVMRTAWDQGLDIGKLPARKDYDVPPYPFPEHLAKADMTPAQREELISWKENATRIHGLNSKLMSKRLATAKTLTIAEKFKGEDSFYFPYQLDFRGRVYAVPMFLQPQGDDRAKSLLTFAKGLPIEDSTGAFWLAIHGANLLGYDKVSLDERAQFIKQMTPEIKQIVADPFENRRWEDADKPWQFLAFCFEWAGLMTGGYGYVSHLPVALDGTCNGLQHFSAMLRDEVGGAAVNLIPSDKPEDIYQRVADVVVRKLRVEADAAEEPEDRILARKWLDWGIGRKTTKRSVMVLPYGGTSYSCRQFIQEHIAERVDDGESDPFDGEHFRASLVLSRLVWDSIGEVVVAARAAMDWLQSTARALSKEELPICWTTPTGFPVMQAYPNLRRRRVKTQCGDSLIYLTLTEDMDTLDTRRQANGISPNFVHSMDGAALQLCVSACAQEGIDSFAMVHDSYGTHAARTEDLAYHLREAFVGMYAENDVLGIFKDEVSKLLSEGKVLDALPSRGALSIEGVMESDFFFS